MGVGRALTVVVGVVVGVMTAMIVLRVVFVNMPMIVILAFDPGLAFAAAAHGAHKSLPQ